MDGIYVVCEECGAVVADMELHVRWHTMMGAVDGEERPQA